MRLSILAMLSAIMSSVSVPQWLTVFSQTTPIPPVFLNEKLWTSGIVTLLAMFLLWQQWIRENTLRTETQSRETRMAGRIDVLELQHAEACTEVAKSIASVALFETQLTQGVADAIKLIDDLKLVTTGAIEVASADRIRQEKAIRVIIDELSNRMDHFTTAIEANCENCNARRNDIAAMVKKIAPE